MPALPRIASFCLALLLSPLLAAQADEEAELERLRSAIEEIRRTLAGTRAERSDVARQVEQREQAILDLRQSIRRLDERIAGTQAELDTLQAQALALEEQRRAQQDLIADYLRGAHREGADSTLKLLLSQDDPTRGSRMLRYYAYLSEARNERIRAWQETLQEISEVSTDISSNQEKLKVEQEALAAEERRLQAGYEERLRLLDQLDTRLGSQQAELARLEGQKEEIELLLEELRNSIADLDVGGAGVPFAELRGKLPWPVAGPVVHAFGSRHELGDLTREGVTIQAAAGTEVRAVHYGRVVFAEWLGNSGLLLIIDHGDGYMSLYAHNQELFRDVGDWVNAGDIVAAVGNTGGKRDAGLYFEIRSNGRAQDPVNWCVARR